MSQLQLQQSTMILKYIAMKNAIITTAITLCAFVVLGQQTSAVMNFKETKHNYGKINEDDGIAYHEFEFINTGNTPLIIQRVSSTCGCTTPQWTKEPVAPSKSGKIRVGYNPKGVKGAFQKSISVYSNATPNVVVLQINGEVNPHVKTLDEIYRIPIGDLFFERNHSALGRLFINKVVTDTLTFINKGATPANVKVNVAAYKHLNVKIAPQTVKPNEFGKIIISYDPKLRNDWGFVADRISLDINGTIQSRTPITITASIEEDFSSLSPKDYENAPQVEFNTTLHNFGTVTEGEPAVFEFVISNKGKSDLIIRKVKASCGCTTVEPSKKVLKPGESSTLKASFRTNGYSGQQSKSITVITNDPKRATSILRLSGTITKKQ